MRGTDDEPLPMDDDPEPKRKFPKYRELDDDDRSFWGKLSPSVKAATIAGGAVLGLCLVVLLAIAFSSIKKRRGDSSDAATDAPTTGPKAPTVDPPSTPDPSTLFPRDRVDAASGEWRYRDTTVIATGPVVIEEEMIVIIVIKNSNEKKKVDFLGWQRSKTLVVDDLGNRYRQFTPGLATQIAMPQAIEKMNMASGPGAVYSDRPRADHIVFERPVKAAKTINIDLDGKQIGMAGPIMFKMSAHPRER